MHLVSDVPAAWLVHLVNEYGTQPRAAAGESEQPYPTLSKADPREATLLTRAELTDLADRLWPVFAAGTAEAQADELTQLLRDAKLVPTVTAEGHLRWLTAADPPRQLLAAGCAATLLTAVEQGSWRRLSTCDADDCVDVHLDHTGRPRRYCSNTCLNRSRVRAYRARHRQAAAR